ncbi:MAG: ATP synthase subunit I [Acidobacteriia bacterium]|nr:ATP synthase subunit I [Terriglobia bacterium]
MGEETISQRSEDFYSGAYGRIVRLMVVLGISLTGGAYLRFGGIVAAGFAVGCAIAMLNFHWLKTVASALVERAATTGKSQSSKGIVGRFLFRYLLVAGAAYVIFRVSLASLYGLLAGLFLPVAAILIEAVYELYVAVRRGE